MFVTKYKVEHTGNPANRQPDLWRIELEIHPTMLDRLFGGKVFPEIRQLEGGYTNWHWVSNKQNAGLFWSFWADCVIKKHLKDHGIMYTHRSTCKSRDK